MPDRVVVTNPPTNISGKVAQAKHTATRRSQGEFVRIESMCGLAGMTSEMVSF